MTGAGMAGLIAAMHGFVHRSPGSSAMHRPVHEYPLGGAPVRCLPHHSGGRMRYRRDRGSTPC